MDTAGSPPRPKGRQPREVRESFGRTLRIACGKMQRHHRLTCRPPSGRGARALSRRAPVDPGAPSLKCQGRRSPVRLRGPATIVHCAPWSSRFFVPLILRRERVLGQRGRSMGKGGFMRPIGSPHWQRGAEHRAPASALTALWRLHRNPPYKIQRLDTPKNLRHKGILSSQKLYITKMGLLVVRFKSEVRLYSEQKGGHRRT